MSSNKVAEEFPEVTTEYMHVDAATIYLVTQPERFDVIVTDNLFGDIITDLAAAVSGGIGVAASGNINPLRRLPLDVRAGPRLRARHRRPGARPSPTAGAVRRPAAARLGYETEAARIEDAVSTDLGDAATCPPRSTSEIGDALAVPSSRLTPAAPLDRIRFEAAGSQTGARRLSPASARCDHQTLGRIHPVSAVATRAR